MAEHEPSWQIAQKSANTRKTEKKKLKKSTEAVCDSI